jgi:hypothetical protein
MERDIIVQNQEQNGLCSGYLKRIGSGQITVKVEETHIDDRREKATLMGFVAIRVAIGRTFSIRTQCRSLFRCKSVKK